MNSSNPYGRYTLAQQELRDIAFASSSENVVGAKFVENWHPHAPRATGFGTARRVGYLPIDIIESSVSYENDEAGWSSVPSQRVVQRRERAATRRKNREANSGWMGRDESVPTAGTSLVESSPRRSDWVLRKDGSHDLVTR
jgi:hypothetical protein